MLDFGYYNIDCTEGMKQFPDKFFDLAIVDPPYGINSHKFGMGRGKGKTLKYVMKPFDTKIPCKKYFNQLFRISKNQIIWGGNYFTKNLRASRCWIAWDKKQPEKMSFAKIELAWTSFDRVADIFHFMYCGAAGNDLKKYIRIHPTQKPVDLYRWLLQHYAKPGDKIIDTHVGSASSLIAFEWEGFFDYVGFELDQDYYHDAKNRLETWRERHFGQYKLALAV